MCFSPNGSQLASLTTNDFHSRVKEVKLWDVATGDCLASMKLDDYWIHNISFTIGETGLILSLEDFLKMEKKMWRISSAPTPFHGSSDADGESYTSNSQALPMVFLREYDQEPCTSPEISPPYYVHHHDSRWVVDRQGRRALWVPTDPGQIIDCNGNKVVFGSTSGVLTIVEFPHAGRLVP